MAVRVFDGKKVNRDTFVTLEQVGDSVFVKTCDENGNDKTYPYFFEITEHGVERVQGFGGYGLPTDGSRVKLVDEID